MTAEFAVAFPALLVVLALALGAVSLAGAQVRAQDAAADAARTLARGGSATIVSAHLERQLPGATVSTWTVDDLVCARVEAPVAGPARLLGLRPSGVSCALGDGR